MALFFEWEPKKARSNRQKHNVSFEEASTVFGDRQSITIPDPKHFEHEERWITIGRSHQGKLLVVVHTENDTSIRLISARTATSAERKQYEEIN